MSLDWKFLTPLAIKTFFFFFFFFENLDEKKHSALVEVLSLP